MKRPDAVTLHAQARRFRSRLIGHLIGKMMRAILKPASKAPPTPMRPAVVR